MAISTNLGRLLMRGAPLFNAPISGASGLPALRRSCCGAASRLITYTGRRSGRTFSIPVAYRRRGDEIEIVPNMPDAKTWWRNFLGDGAPMSLTLDGIEQSGHAVAHRDENGRVTVRVRLAGAQST